MHIVSWVSEKAQAWFSGTCVITLKLYESYKASNKPTSLADINHLISFKSFFRIFVFIENYLYILFHLTVIAQFLFVLKMTLIKKKYLVAISVSDALNWYKVHI